MDMGNIVLHMLDQVRLLPSLVPEYVHCCQLTCLNGYSPAKKKFKPAFWPASMPKIARTPWGVGIAASNVFEEICSIRASVTMREWENWFAGTKRTLRPWILVDGGCRVWWREQVAILYVMRHPLGLGGPTKTKKENLTSRPKNESMLGKASNVAKYSNDQFELETIG